jgi:hypothetical protein
MDGFMISKCKSSIEGILNYLLSLRILISSLKLNILLPKVNESLKMCLASSYYEASDIITLC